MKSKKIFKLVSLGLLGTTIAGISPITANAAWKQNSTGWWYTEGSSWATGWRNIDGKWYFFDGNGYMKTGWVNDKGTWYYLDSTGAMKTGWVNDGGTWYYLEESGAMKTGWLSYNGSWYFLKSSGAMASNEIIEDKGDKYCLADSGAMVTGWKNFNGNTYYFNQGGDAAKGIKEIDGSRYYFYLDTSILMVNATVGDITTDSEGKITSYVKIGWNSISLVKKYYVDADGTRHLGWLEDDGKKYYAGKDGIMVNGVNKIDGELYYFNTNGELDMTPGMRQYFVVDYGVSPKAYVNEDGTFAKGWKTIDGKKYYFDENGASAQGISKIKSDDEEYYFDCYSSELVCDANYYGITTDEKGKVEKLNIDLAKNDILENDSETFNKLKEKYGDISLEYFKVNNMRDIYTIASDIANVETNKRYSYDEDGDVFIFRCKSNSRKETYANYYVSVKTGNIYVEYTGKGNEDIIYKIKDNKQVEKYEIDYICIEM